MDRKEESQTKSHDWVEGHNNNDKEPPVNSEGVAEAKEHGVEQDEAFDPETADRDVLLDKYRELEDRLAAREDRILRAVADAENTKKRLQREKDEQIRYANETLMKDLLPVIDNIERAIEHSNSGSDQDGLIEGLNMTRKGFLDSLAKYGCKPVEAVGEIFDPNLHEAVSQQESANHEANTVLGELQKGYILKDRLLRPAMVVVSKPPSQIEDVNLKQADAENDKTDQGSVRIKVKKG